MREVVVLGVGMTQFGKFPEKSIEEFSRAALWDALKDARLKPRDIQVAYVGSMLAGRICGLYSCMAEIVLNEVGIKGIPITHVENACSSGATAFREVWLSIASGAYDVGLALGVEKMTGRLPAPLVRERSTMEGVMGMVMPGIWAMRAQKHMESYGTTIEQLAKISLKNHKNGCLNPRSQFQKEVTVEEVLNSPVICDPLTLLHSCAIGDGAAAAVLVSKDIAKLHSVNPEIIVAASALTSGTYESQRDFSSNDLEKRAGRIAYEMAGIGPDDIDFAEVHDCFTIAEVLRCESLGLCAEGEYCKLLGAGKWDIDGDMPINPSGGLLSKGHPVGATGVAQIAEIVWQLRGEAGKRQVKNAIVGLAHCSGGYIDGDTGACTVQILKK